MIYWPVCLQVSDAQLHPAILREGKLVKRSETAALGKVKPAATTESQNVRLVAPNFADVGWDDDPMADPPSPRHEQQVGENLILPDRTRLKPVNHLPKLFVLRRFKREVLKDACTGDADAPENGKVKQLERGVIKARDCPLMPANVGKPWNLRCPDPCGVSLKVGIQERLAVSTKKAIPHPLLHQPRVAALVYLEHSVALVVRGSMEKLGNDVGPA